MTRTTAVTALVAPWVITAACDRETEVQLSDSEGRVIRALCTEEECKLRQTGGPIWPGDRTELRLRTEGRVVGVCNTRPSGTVESAGDCRALRCESDAECPPAHGREHGACLGGICTDPSHAVGPGDAVMMCLWQEGLGRETPAQAGRLALGLNCGDPCEIPSPCHGL